MPTSIPHPFRSQYRTANDYYCDDCSRLQDDPIHTRALLNPTSPRRTTADPDQWPTLQKWGAFRDAAERLIEAAEPVYLDIWDGKSTDVCIYCDLSVKMKHDSDCPWLLFVQAFEQIKPKGESK